MMDSYDEDAERGPELLIAVGQDLWPYVREAYVTDIVGTGIWIDRNTFSGIYTWHLSSYHPNSDWLQVVAYEKSFFSTPIMFLLWSLRTKGGLLLNGSSDILGFPSDEC